MSEVHPATPREQLLELTLSVNGAPYRVRTPARRLLSDCLRHDLGLTGTHVGCEHGVCGACTVLLDGLPARSCLMLAASAEGHEITTVEGLAPGADPTSGATVHDHHQPTGGDHARLRQTQEGGGEREVQLSAVQRAFRESHALQCGFCTPGFLTTVTAFLAEVPDPTPEQAREAIAGNLCRCTGYQNIVTAVLRAAEILCEPARPNEHTAGQEDSP